MLLDKAIINPKDDPKLASSITALLEEFRQTNEITVGRIFTEEILKFLRWIEREYPRVHKDIKERYGIRISEGTFEVNAPEKLPLNVLDLEEEDSEEFLVECKKDLDSLSPEETSETIWEWAVHNAKDYEKLYFVEHAWVTIGDLIIDFSWSQFNKAIDNKENLRERYHKS